LGRRADGERADDPECVLRRRPEDPLRFSGVPDSAAFVTAGSSVLLRKREAERATGRPRRRQGRSGCGEPGKNVSATAEW
jgi:hypothetical protein